MRDEEDKRFLLDLLLRFHEGYALNVYHWAIMANHFHLAVETLEMEDLSRFVGKTLRRFTVYHHKRHGGSGPLWSRRFTSILVQKEGYLGALGRYIETNPVRAGMVDLPWAYPFSSARAYVRGEDDGLVSVADHPTWLDLSAPQASARSAYAAYLCRDDEQSGDAAVFGGGGPPVVGDESFVTNSHVTGIRRTSRSRGRKRTRKRFSLPPSERN